MSTSGQAAEARAWPEARRQGEMADGKGRLITAAVRLGAAGRSLHSLGVRELAREAGLNPNTFYRHFSDMDDLGIAVADVVAGQVIEGTRAARAHFTSPADAGAAVIGFYFEFVSAHPEIMTVALQERFGGTPRLRASIRRVLDLICDENVAHMVDLGWDRNIDRARFRDLGRAIVLHLFHQTRDYLDATSADARQAVVDECRRFARTLTIGALAGSSSDRDRPSA